MLLLLLRNSGTVEQQPVFEPVAPRRFADRANANRLGTTPDAINANRIGSSTSKVNASRLGSSRQ
jgi:hypothetical protein